MCVGSGSSVSRARWQISYAAIAKGGWGGPRLCGRGDLFSLVRVVFFATFPERSRSGPRQTTEPFRKELKNASICSLQTYYSNNKMKPCSRTAVSFNSNSNLIIISIARCPYAIKSIWVNFQVQNACLYCHTLFSKIRHLKGILTGAIIVKRI